MIDQQLVIRVGAKPIRSQGNYEIVDTKNRQGIFAFLRQIFGKNGCWKRSKCDDKQYKSIHPKQFAVRSFDVSKYMVMIYPANHNRQETY